MRGYLKSRYLRFGVIVTSAITLCACNPYPFNKEEFGAIVKSWHLEDKSPEDTVNLLTQKGFKVGRNKAEKWFKDQREYIYATQRTGAVICSLEWRIILKLEQEKIAEVNPLVFSQCL